MSLKRVGNDPIYLRNVVKCGYHWNFFYHKALCGTYMCDNNMYKTVLGGYGGVDG